MQQGSPLQQNKTNGDNGLKERPKKIDANVFF